MKKVHVQQRSNPRFIRLLMVANLACLFLLLFFHFNRPEMIPKLYYINLAVSFYFGDIYKKVNEKQVTNNTNIEFRKSSLWLILLMFLPLGVTYLCFAYIFAASPSTVLIAYIVSMILGAILLTASGWDRVILKNHTVTFMSGAFPRRTKTIAYEKVTDISVYAATYGIEVTTSDGSTSGKHSWLGNLDNLQKLLEQRVRIAHENKPTGNNALPLDEIVDRRVKGLITDEELAAAVEK